jgi:hypothetical protein
LVEDRDGIGVIVARGNDLVTRAFDKRFIVEGRQWLVLDNKDPLDDLFALAEQHRWWFPAQE